MIEIEKLLTDLGYKIQEFEKQKGWTYYLGGYILRVNEDDKTFSYVLR